MIASTAPKLRAAARALLTIDLCLLGGVRDFALRPGERVIRNIAAYYLDISGKAFSMSVFNWETTKITKEHHIIVM